MTSPNIVKPIFEHLTESQRFTGHPAPRLSWRFSYDASTVRSWNQKAYEVEVTSNNTPQTFHVDSHDSVLVPWPRTPLSPREKVSVRVRALGAGLDNGNVWTPWSDSASVEGVLFDPSAWKASWITSSQRLGPSGPLQPLRFYKPFAIPIPSRKARLYISALGVYDVYINGHKVSDEFLAPGWTSYNHRVAYRVLDVGSFLKEDNVICIEVAEGWYAGRLGFKGGKRFWYAGDEQAILAQLEVDEQTVTTDNSWTVAASAIQSSELYDGERYDTTREWDNWQTTSPKNAVSTKTIQPPSKESKIFFADAPPVRVTERIRPKEIFKSTSGKTIIDFGQNLVGKLEVRSLSAPTGHQTTFRHAEVMEHGELGIRPLRFAKATDTIISSGQDVHKWTPKFTFHGFRYVQVDGWPDALGPTESDLTALVTHTDMRRRGFFECSNKSVNQLHRNVVWSMRGNFLSIPTDCPQRDERLGWTGDLQVFAPSATFLYDTVGMLGDWLQDVALEQLEDGKGGIPGLVCPDVLPPNWPKMPQAVWDDIVVLTPNDLYRFSADTSILERQFESMEAYLYTAVDRGEDGLWNFDRWQLADWLDPAAPPDDPGYGRTDGVLVADAYLVHVTQTFAAICAALGKTSRADRVGKEAEALKREFQHKYISPKGNLMSNSQTGLALAIQYSLYETTQQLSVAAKALEKLVRSARFHISTGFAGTPIITHALTRVQKPQLAYRMLLETTCPSWIYPVTMGATTIWERWNSMLEDGTINPGQMTSFNHYALGAVVDWLHGTVGGISPLEPGWRRIKINPVPGGNVTHANVKFEGPYGWISCDWKIQEERFEMEVSVPPNTVAEVTLPSGLPKGLEQEREGLEVVGSGVHIFSCKWEAEAWPPTPIVASNQPMPTNDTIAQ